MIIFSIYNDFFLDRCSVSDIIYFVFIDVVILEIRMGKFRKIEIVEVIYRLKIKYYLICVFLGLVFNY